MASRLTAGELGELAGTTPDRVGELSRLGLIKATAGRFGTGDVHRVRLVEAFEAAGVPAEALARASQQGTISLAYYDELHQEPGAPSARTYGELVAGLADRGPSLRRLFGAVGLAEPEPSDRLPGDDEALLLTLLEALEANPDRDLALRTFRVFGESARRASEAAMSVYAEAVERAAADIAGLPSEEVYGQFLRPWARFARLVPRLSAWLHMRHLSAAIDAWSVEETERLLAQTGFVPDRDVGQPAVAFIDLTGFTDLTERRGDRAAAEVAGAFAELAAELAERRRGRLVKQLGDGVLLRFPEPLPAVDAALAILDALDGSTLPSGHGGVAAGPLIVREGDVFGRTVNRASRIADQAHAGELLATAGLADQLPPDRIVARPAGSVVLQGIADVVPLVRLMRVTAGRGS